MSDIVATIPKDSQGTPFERAQGVPIVCDDKILGSANYVDVFDLSSYSTENRAFTGISIYNPSSTLKIYVALTDFLGTDKCITVQANGFLTFDQQSFGPGFLDSILAKRVTRVRAKLSATSGTLSTLVLDYDGGGSPINPADGKCVLIEGTVFEFSNDLSVVPGRVKVDIAATADLSWTNLKNAINLNLQSVVAAIDTTANTVTLTSNYSGAYAIAAEDGSGSGANTTGVTVGANSAGSGGVTPIFHVW